MPIDLTKYCALCGGQLQRADGIHFAFGSLKDMERAEVYYEYGPAHALGQWLPAEFRPCSCTSRTDRGKCGDCQSCRIEVIGCGCDGAYDDGCFNCTPDRYTRPPCPDLYTKEHADEHTQKTR